jgi:hypothetical protein
MNRAIAVLFFCLIFASSTFAQGGRESVKLTAGVEFRALVPISFFTMDSLVLSDTDNNFTATYRYRGGFGFGGVIRIRLTDFWNIETGIYYTRRKYSVELRDPPENFAENYDNSVDLRTIGYELPVKGLVYLQMADQVYMNVALGVSADFFASDVRTRESSYFYVSAFKDHWIRMAALGNLGVEYRTEENGIFYLGGSIHQPFGDIMTTQVNYVRPSDNNGAGGKTYFQNGKLDGAYFSIDFRYFFPHKEEDKSKIKRYEPDWDNM